MEEYKYIYTPLPEPIPITEQVWPEGTLPLVHTRTLAYMHENYIRDCIEGILMQRTTFPVLVLIHDDASTDKTAEIIREYEQRYPHLIKAHYQKENSHTKPDRYEHRTEFHSWETGKYVAFCDSDDYWTDPLKLQKQVDFLEANPDYGLVYTRTRYYIQEQNKFQGHLGAYCDTFESLLLRNVIPTLTVVARKDLYDEYFHEIKPNNQKWLLGDWPGWLWFAKRSKIRYENYVTSVYRELPESMSRSDDQEKMERLARSRTSIAEYFIDRYGGEEGNTPQDVFLLKTWLLFKYACLADSRRHLFDKIRMDIDKIQTSPLSFRLLYMKLVLFCRPMRHLFVTYIKIQRIIRR